MTRLEVLEGLKHMSNTDRLTVIEAASRLVREQLPEPPRDLTDDDDPILRVAGCLSGSPLSGGEEIDQELYGKETG